MKIFVVCAHEGAHYEYQRWNVCVYRIKKKAEKHAQLAEEWAGNKQTELGEKYGIDAWEHVEEAAKKNPYDKDATSLEAEYFVDTLEVRAYLPKVKK